MKKLFLFLAVMALVSCEQISPPLTFKIIGKGELLLSFTDSGGSSTYYGYAQTFKRDMLTDEFYYLSAQGTQGVRVECYYGAELIKSQSASGYGIASISGVYK